MFVACTYTLRTESNKSALLLSFYDDTHVRLLFLNFSTWVFCFHPKHLDVVTQRASSVLQYQVRSIIGIYNTVNRTCTHENSSSATRLHYIVTSRLPTSKKPDSGPIDRFLARALYLIHIPSCRHTYTIKIIIQTMPSQATIWNIRFVRVGSIGSADRRRNEVIDEVCQRSVGLGLKSRNCHFATIRIISYLLP